MVSKSRCVYVVTLVALSIGMLGLLTGCPDEAASLEDGTITIRLIDAEDHNGKEFYCAVVVAGDETLDIDNALGLVEGPAIAGGTYESIVFDVATSSIPVVFTGGEYGVAGYIDVDNDDDITPDDWLTDPIKTIEVDGSIIVELVYPADFIEIQ